MFEIRPIDAAQAFFIDNLIRNTKIKHDEKTGCGKLFKKIISYKEGHRYSAMFCDCLSIFLYPPRDNRDFYILKIEVPANGTPANR